jgi:hypothetical protein
MCAFFGVDPLASRVCAMRFVASTCQQLKISRLTDRLVPEYLKFERRCRVQEMGASISVDSLASGKGFWSNMLGISVTVSMQSALLVN